MITGAEIGEDMNPRHLLLTLRRLRCSEGQQSSWALVIHQQEKDSIPEITVHDTGEEVVWTLAMGTMARGAKQLLHSDLSSNEDGSLDMASAYKRPL